MTAWRSLLLRYSTAALKQTPIVIVGAGPTGLTTALLLAKYNIPCLVLERSSALTTHPQAHFINHRTMEIFRGLDNLSEEIVSIMPPLSTWRRFIYCSTMSGQMFGSVDHFPGQNEASDVAGGVSPEPVAHLSQNRLLPLLAKRVFQQPTIDLRMGHRFVGFKDLGASGVEVKVEDVSSKSIYSIQTRTLVGADGARGHVRKALHIDLIGPGPIQHLINIHFNSPELGRHLKASNREAMLYFVFNSSVIVVMVAHDIIKGEFVAQVPFFPPLQKGEEYTPEVSTDVVRSAVGLPHLQLEIKQVRPWTMAAGVAETYGRGNILLAGDAAHVVPPSGAFGMNTGIQDAHNLAWKLAAKELGFAGNKILATYEKDRRPIAIANMNLSVDNFYEALRIPRSLGLDFLTANAVRDLLESPILRWAPSQVRRTALDSALAAGKIGAAAIAPFRRAAMEDIVSSGHTLRLQYPKEDLGFIYDSPLKNGSLSLQDVDLIRSYSSPKPRDAPYQPTTLPGTRFFHFDLFDYDSNGMISSIDLTSPENGWRMVLVVSKSEKVTSWVAAASAIQSKSRTSLHVVILIQDDAEKAEMEVFVGKGVSILKCVDESWEKCRGLSDGGAILLRPDGHVAWRGEDETQLATIFMELLN